MYVILSQHLYFALYVFFEVVHIKLFSNFRQETEKKMSGDVTSRARKSAQQDFDAGDRGSRPQILTCVHCRVMFLTYLMYIM